jgi:hypothetical protein
MAKCNDDLEAMADELLRQTGRADECPWLTQQQLDRQSRRRNRPDSLEAVYDHASVVRRVRSLVAILQCSWAEIREMHVVAGVSSAEYHALRYYVWDGYTYVRIGKEMGCSDVAAAQRIIRALTKLGKLPSMGLLTVMAEVFQRSIDDICWLLDQ